jgi:hypothetical protein
MTGLSPEPTDRAVARLLAAGLRARVRIDYNTRDRLGRVRARFDVCDRIPAVGEHVTVYAPDDGTETDAVVTGLDEDRELIYLDVAWSDLRATAPDAL